MAIISSQQIDWNKRLPRYVRKWIKDERHQDFSEIVRVNCRLINPYSQYGISSMSGFSCYHRYEVTFVNGFTAERDFLPYSENCGSLIVRIASYNEIEHPHFWLHTYIMEQVIPGNLEVPDYSRTDVAYRIIPHLLKRGEYDPLARLFLRNLVDDKSVEDEVLPTLVRMEYIAMAYTASQMCSAAYAAYNEWESTHNG